MGVWVFLPVALSSVSFFGTWTIYALAYNNRHVCSLGNWDVMNCSGNASIACCKVPTISTSGASLPESSLFSATINAAAFLFAMFCVCHHAHILNRNRSNAMLSRIALVFGAVSALGAFMAGNCNPRELKLLHYLGAAVSFLCICFYTFIVTVLTGKCVLTGLERLLYPARIISTVIQISATISYFICFGQKDYVYMHLSAVFEWLLSVNLELFELSFALEFYCFSSFMLAVLLPKKDEEKSLILT